MGLMDKFGKAMENAVAKNMTGASKEEYEKDKAASLAQKQEKEEQAKQVKAEFEAQAVSLDKEDLKDLDTLLQKTSFIDSEKIWLAGFPNFKTGYNAVLSNVLTGKKNLKFLTKNGEMFFLLKIENSTLAPYKCFSKSDVTSVETESKLLTKSIKIKFVDGQSYSVDITANKDKAKVFKNILK